MILVMDATHQTCVDCGKSKPLSEFYKASRNTLGVMTFCKYCYAIRKGMKPRRKLPDGFKYCPECKNDLPLDAFAKGYCRSCHAKRERVRRSANREVDLKRKREYREKNRAKIAEYQKKYQIQNADLFNEYKRKRRALERDALYLGHTVEDLKMKLHYYGGKCWICREAEHEHWDHIKPLSKGGAHILANLRPSCAKCNVAKNNKWPFTRPN